jgi:hypothetical protein
MVRTDEDRHLRYRPIPHHRQWAVRQQLSTDHRLGDRVPHQRIDRQLAQTLRGIRAGAAVPRRVRITVAFRLSHQDAVCTRTALHDRGLEQPARAGRGELGAHRDGARRLTGGGDPGQITPKAAKLRCTHRIWLTSHDTTSTSSITAGGADQQPGTPITRSGWRAAGRICQRGVWEGDVEAGWGVFT